MSLDRKQISHLILYCSCAHCPTLEIILYLNYIISKLKVELFIIIEQMYLIIFQFTHHSFRKFIKFLSFEINDKFGSF